MANEVQEDERGRQLAEPTFGAAKADSSTGIGGGIDQAESYANDPKNASGQGGGVGGAAASAAAKAVPAGRLAMMAANLAGFAQKNKKGLGIGGGMGGLIVLLILGFTALLPLKLFDIEKNLFSHNFKVEENTEKKLTSKLFERLGPYDEAGRRQIKGKGFFGNKWAQFRVDRFDARLETKGVKLTVDPVTHELVSIERNGVKTDLSNAKTIERARAVIGVVNDEVPPWQIGKRIKFIKLMTLRYNVSFRFWEKEKIANLSDYLKNRANKIRNGASASEMSAADALDRGAQVDPKTKVQSIGAANDQAGSSIVKDVQDNFSKTSSIKEALKAGTDAFNSSGAAKSIGIAGMIAIICQVQKLADEAVTSGYDQRALELMRMGGTLLAAASQLRNGQGIDSTTMNYLMQQYEGDPNAKPIVQTDSSGNVISSTPAEDSLDFTQSADWQRSQGQPVMSGNPEMNPAANPDSKTGLASVIGVIDAFAQATGGAAVCNLVNTAFGQIALLAGGIAEVIGNVLDGGIEELAATTAKFAVQAVLITQVIPHILAGAAGLAITGTENAIQTLSFNNAGMGLMASDYARSFGAAPISDATYGQLADEATQSNVAEAKSKGLAYNLFSADNTNSLTSKLIRTAPASPRQAFTGIASIFMNMPKFFKANILGLISPARAADNASDNPNQFQRYGFTDAEVNKYEVDTLANYFETPVINVNGQSIARIDILGNPDDFSFGTQDENTSDALHCFVNSFINPESSGPDSICLNIGYITQNVSGVSVATEGDFQKTIQTNVYDVYCKANISKEACPFKAAADEMLRYRLYLAYQHIGAQLVDVTSTEPSVATTTTGDPGSYKDPMRDVKNLSRSQVDAGVDYGGDTGSVVHPVGNAKLLKVVRAGAGWSNACCYLSYQLIDGPAKNLTVFVAENCRAAAGLNVGDTVNADTVLCNLVDSTFIETGWATTDGRTSAASGTQPTCYRGLSDNRPDSWGINFNSFLIKYGFTSGSTSSLQLTPIPCTLPANLPAWN